MTDLKQKIDLNNIDKSNWKTYRFDEIAQKISEPVDPNTTDLEIYVGLEHLDADSIHIKRHGTRDDVNGQKLGFHTGDVIFGKRRAYQRKAAVAKTKGFCSAHAFVLRAIPNVIDPMLFPFFIHSDTFMHRAVDISVGSLSPTINWGTLKHQEFLIPPIVEQPQFTMLFSSLDAMTVLEKAILHSCNLNIRTLQKSLFNKSKITRCRLSKYADVIGGYAFSSNSFVNEGTPVVKIKNIVQGKISVTDGSNHIDLTKLNNVDKYLLKEDDILIAMTGATLGKIGVVQKEFNGALLNQRVGKFQIRQDIDKWFIRGVLDSHYFGYELNKYIGEGAQGNISAVDITKTLVPDLTESKTKKLGVKFRKFYETIELIKFKYKSSKALQNSLINQVF